jgi:hypothetical protein
LFDVDVWQCLVERDGEVGRGAGSNCSTWDSVRLNHNLNVNSIPISNKNNAMSNGCEMDEELPGSCQREMRLFALLNFLPRGSTFPTAVNRFVLLHT